MPRRPRPAPQARSDRGATLVETSVSVLLLLVLVLGMIEFGLLFRDNLVTTDAVADSARLGGVVGPNIGVGGANADFEIVRALREGMASMSDRDVAAIVVFRANGSGDDPQSQVSATCKRGIPVIRQCNVYDPAAAFAAVEAGNAAYFACTGAGEPSCSWDPTTRDNGPAETDVETVGVYVRIVRPGYTKLFGNEWTISRASTARIEAGPT